jgi:C4-dicarboxylate-specific signal transduction histidine kinase
MISGSTTHRLAFRPRARLVSILGEHLISDQAVALVELVKNAYDADARSVRIGILGTDDPESARVTITDDGTGMTLEDVTTRWMSPALDEKEQAKESGRRTALGRLPIGEKGVGRFALHQLGRSLEMVTRAADCPELVVAIDWDDYDRSDTYLADVEVRVVERSPEVFGGHSTGTRLTIDRPRSAWSEKLLRKVHRTLRRLQSPLRELQEDFKVRLECPGHPELENIEPTDILERAHYEFRTLVESGGGCDYEYVCRLPGIPPRQTAGSENLVSLAADELRGATPQCGPFWFNLYVWDRSRDALQASGVPRAELDALCGVSIYRDGLRVLPYGEPGNDWLFLDQERIQAPAERVGNNQLIGLVEVDQSTNLRLRDKTNREGLIENDAFLDLRALARAAMRVFTVQWRRDRPPARPSEHRKHPAESVEGARHLAEAIRTSARDDVQVQVTAPALATTQPTQPSETPTQGAETSVSQRQAVDLLIDELDDVQQGIDVRRQRFERVLHLAATGLAAERVVHEFGRQLVAAADSLRHLRGPSEQRRAEAAATLQAVITTLESEFRILAPYESVRRRPRLSTIGARELAQIALRLNERNLDESAVVRAVSGEDFDVTTRGTEILQILDNLIHNASYWLGTLPAERERRLEVILRSDHRSIVVADTGPGLSRDVRALAFEPFFSMKTDGTGLGLYISAELARSAGASLALLDDGASRRPAWAVGASFELVLAGDDGAPRA